MIRLPASTSSSRKPRSSNLAGQRAGHRASDARCAGLKHNFVVAGGTAYQQRAYFASPLSWLLTTTAGRPAYHVQRECADLAEHAGPVTQLGSGVIDRAGDGSATKHSVKEGVDLALGFRLSNCGRRGDLFYRRRAPPNPAGLGDAAFPPRQITKQQSAHAIRAHCSQLCS